MAANKPPRSQVAWSQVKEKLAAFDRPALIALLQDLYAASRENQAFLHSRFGLGEDPLRPYKETIARALARPEQAHLGRGGEEGDSELQQGQRPRRGHGRADGLLLRAGGRIRPRHGTAGRRLFRRPLANVRTRADSCRRVARRGAGGQDQAPRPSARALPRHRLWRLRRNDDAPRGVGVWQSRMTSLRRCAPSSIVFEAKTPG